MRYTSTTLLHVALCLGLLLSAFGCDTGVPKPPSSSTDDNQLDSDEPHVSFVENDKLFVGETVLFYGQNFLEPSQGQTFLRFDGTYTWEDESGQRVTENVKPFSIAGLYDGRFPDGGEINGEQLAPQTEVLRWNRFGPFEVPFGGQGRRAGTFEGTITAVNVLNSGDEIVDTAPMALTLEVKPSILITRLEPVVDFDENNEVITAGCESPALRVFGGIPYILEVEAINFVPDYFFYKISNAQKKLSLRDTQPGEWLEYQHEAVGQTDVIGYPNPENQEPIIFNLMDDDQEFAVATLHIQASSKDSDEFYETKLPLRVVRPMAFAYDGNREIAEYYEPVMVNGPIPGGVGTTVTYSEQQSESRQRGVAVSVSSNFSQSQGISLNNNWAEGFSSSTTNSETNSVGQSHSESESASETYGTSYGSSSGTNTNIATTDGTTWSWNVTESESEDNSFTQAEEAYGTVSAGLSTEVGGKGSVPGFAEVSGKVGTSVGTTVGAKQGNSSGQRIGSATSHGMNSGGSSSESVAFGSTTTDTVSESISGSYAVASVSAINSNLSVQQAATESVTYSMGGSESITEGFTTGQSESYTETWQESATDSTLLSFSGKVPNDQCAVIYRQTVRYVRTTQLYAYDQCGVRSLVGEMHFNEWSWSPNIALGTDCDEALPEPDLPEAECFIACE